MDINAAVGRVMKIGDEKLAELDEFRTSPRFTDAEKAALAYAEEMCRVPVDVPDETFATLREHFSDVQIVELTAAVALENLRARFNCALLIESDGLCALPDDHPVRRAAAAGVD
jgi:alkylhydroperoxidase family enzyme